MLRSPPRRENLMPARRLAFLCALLALCSTAVVAGVATARDGAAAATSLAFRPLPFHYDLYTFRGREGRTAVVTAFAVEAGRLETESVASRVRYRFSVTLVLADTARRTVSNTHDTVYVDVPRPMPDAHLLYTHVEVLAPPSKHTRQRVIMIDATTPGIGQLYTEAFPIPDYSGSELMLSDIALGQPGAVSGWEREGVTLALLPTTRFPASAFDVYYEIYNLPAGVEYTTEIAIERLDPRGSETEREPVRLRFSDRSTAGADAAQREFRRVDAALARGSYRLVVTIVNTASGAVTRRSRTFEVRGPEKGATMVPALRSQPLGMRR